MSKILLDFTVFPGFGAVQDVDFGPGTTHPIRYSIADYKTALKESVDGPTFAPLVLGYSVTINGSTGSPSGFGSTEGLLSVSGSNQFIFGDEAIVTDFPSCPFADGIGPPREDADVQISGTMVATISLSLSNPRSEQSGWDTVTHVWLPFTLDIPSLHRNQSYECIPSGDSGDGPLDIIPTDFAGIDYAASGLTPTSIALGDGTTHAFFITPVDPNNTITTTSLVTTNF